MEKPSFNPNKLETLYHNAINEIILDLSDRRGIRHAWDGTNKNLQKEISRAWEETLRKEADPEKAAELIIADLTDRRGLKQEWEKIDENTQAEIKQTWTELIRKHTQG